MAVEQIEAAVMSERIAVAVLATAGAKDLDWPTVEQARKDYDDYLTAEPTRMAPVDAERFHLHRALGVA